MSSVATFETDARSALRTILATVLGTGDVPGDTDVAWENRTFAPPAPSDRPWLKERLVLGPLEAISRGPKPLLKAEGTYFVDVQVPLDENVERGAGIVGALRGAFHPRAAATVNGLEVSIRYVATGPGQRVDGWYRIPLTIAWYAYVQNAV